MNQNLENKSDNIIKNIIGFLLIMPIYIIFCILLKLMNFDGNIILPWLMYLPIIIGIFLSLRLYKDKVSHRMGICIILFLCLAIYFYYNAFYIKHPGWDGLGYSLLWFGTTCICKILSCIFYGKIVGWKKALLFLSIYIIIFICNRIVSIVKVSLLYY